VPLATGQVLGGWGLTEPTAGSDAAGTRTMARRDGTDWVIDGAKTFITHGNLAGVMVAMAVTDRALGNRGISAFVIAAGTPGMRAGRKENKLGMRASETSEVIFENCRVPEDALLGAQGQGFINTLQVLDAGRIGIAALSVGLAQGAYDAARAYALQRQQFGQAIASFQGIRWKLADLATRIEAARLLTYRAAWLADQGKFTKEWVPYLSMCKYYATELAVKVSNHALQMLGAAGYMQDHPMELYYRDAKQLTIVEGTSQVQLGLIARGVLDHDLWWD
jgi:alkylation response protein AidB-like acyl-CoA dehydrogenase